MSHLMLSDQISSSTATALSVSKLKAGSKIELVLLMVLNAESASKEEAYSFL